MKRVLAISHDNVIQPVKESEKNVSAAKLALAIVLAHAVARARCTKID